MTDIPMSVLDLPMIEVDRSASEILSGLTDVARRVEQLGYRRLWYPEHHASAGIADFPPSVVGTHIAAATSTIRVGCGGVLAPNHAPLAVAEQFGALAALHPGRIDLGIGRGPGTLDQQTARALRRGAAPTTDDEYRDDVTKVLRLVGERAAVPEPWLLSSSPAGAGLAARLGLPIAFAHHLRPQHTEQALAEYRANFQPSRWADSPRVILSIMVFCADTEADARRAAGPLDVMLSTARVEGREIPLPTPRAAAAHVFSAKAQAFIDGFRAGQILGGPRTVTRRLTELAARFDADELMLTTAIYDSKDRIRSFELVATAR
ncbi:MAG TPA: LLM class flavin-dependent oxidoreductase [Pseudonocardiaceae bacterium]|nr:LLM class flavin-dependent oxidoreductase [Pseudonocardiaceae bacterium]